MSGFQYIGIILSLLPMAAVAAEPADTSVVEMHEVVVTGKHSMLKMRGTAANSELITASDLKRAACCSLGESFTTNPSVDVSYSDAATGARQIKLLGLSGAYVQMLSENVPALRGAGAPSALATLPDHGYSPFRFRKAPARLKTAMSR